jgi:hypothetical protein
MDFVIDFNSDAFKHGVNEADIRRACHSFGMTTTRLYMMVYLDESDDEDAKDKYLLIGFNCKANPIEILYNFVSDYHINVFHAMPCRNIYHHLLKPKESQWRT